MLPSLPLVDGLVLACLVRVEMLRASFTDAARRASLLRPASFRCRMQECRSGAPYGRHAQRSAVCIGSAAAQSTAYSILFDAGARGSVVPARE